MSDFGVYLLSAFAAGRSFFNELTKEGNSRHGGPKLTTYIDTDIQNYAFHLILSGSCAVSISTLAVFLFFFGCFFCPSHA